MAKVVVELWTLQRLKEWLLKEYAPDTRTGLTGIMFVRWDGIPKALIWSPETEKALRDHDSALGPGMTLVEVP